MLDICKLPVYIFRFDYAIVLCDALESYKDTNGAQTTMAMQIQLQITVAQRRDKAQCREQKIINFLPWKQEPYLQEEQEN